RGLLALAIRADQARYPQYPALDLRHGPFGRRKVELQEARERAVAVGAREPGGDAEGVVLVGRAPFGREAAAPQRRIDLSNRGAVGGDVPAVERPEMHTGATAMADEPQPGNPRVRRFRHRALHVELKHRLSAAGALLGQPPPTGIAGARCAVAHHALAHEIDIGVIVVGRPMALEVIEEGAGQSGLRPYASK